MFFVLIFIVISHSQILIKMNSAKINKAETKLGVKTYYLTQSKTITWNLKRRF